MSHVLAFWAWFEVRYIIPNPSSGGFRGVSLLPMYRERKAGSDRVKQTCEIPSHLLATLRIKDLDGVIAIAYSLTMMNAQAWTDMMVENVANGHALHPEIRIQSASLAALLDAAARSVVVVADDAPVSSVLPTIPVKAA